MPSRERTKKKRKRACRPGLTRVEAMSGHPMKTQGKTEMSTSKGTEIRYPTTTEYVEHTLRRRMGFGDLLSWAVINKRMNMHAAKSRQRSSSGVASEDSFVFQKTKTFVLIISSTMGPIRKANLFWYEYVVLRTCTSTCTKKYSALAACHVVLCAQYVVLGQVFTTG